MAGKFGVKARLRFCRARRQETSEELPTTSGLVKDGIRTPKLGWEIRSLTLVERLGDSSASAGFCSDFRFGAYCPNEVTLGPLQNLVRPHERRCYSSNF